MDKKQITKQQKNLLIKEYKNDCQQAILFFKKDIELFKFNFAAETHQLSLLRKKRFQEINNDKWISILKNFFKKEDEKRKEVLINKLIKLKETYKKEEIKRKNKLIRDLKKIQN